MKNYSISLVLVLTCVSLNAQIVRLVEQYFPDSSLNGAYCPNVQDDQIGPGGIDFNGGVEFTQENTWRIETGPESSVLYLDVVFSFNGTRNTNAFVRGRRSLEIFRQEGTINSIVGFRQVRDNFNGYTSWMTTATGNSSWTGDGDGGVFCEDDNEADIKGVTEGGLIDGIFFNMDIQGDTGGADISEDRNCSCDTRVLKIYWNRNIQVAIARDIDRDGLQDRRFFSELEVDNDIRRNADTVKLLIDLDGNDIKGAIHNDDCRRFNGNIRAVIVNTDTNRPYPNIRESVLINWSNGNRTRDYLKRDLGSVQTSKIFCNVPRSDLENGKVSLILAAYDLRECHKKCDLCSDYRCNIRYQNSEKILLNRFANITNTNTMIVDARINSNDNHYLELPIKVSY